MNNELKEILKKYSSEDSVFYENSNANNVFFQLFTKNIENEVELLKIVDDLLSQNLIVDNLLLQTLSKNLCINTIEYLKEKGNNINLEDDNGENILFKVFETSRYLINDTNFAIFKSCIERLIQLGVNYKLVNENGRNLIHKATYNGATESILKLITELDIDINKQDNDGFTPLHFAVMNASFNQIEILINNGSKSSKYIKTKSFPFDTVDIPAPNGLTPLELFKYNINDYVDLDFDGILEVLK